MATNRTYVYIDGFNLYYGCLKRTQFKWLDVEKLCQAYLPGCSIKRIYYFTAIVSGTADDPDKHIRQQAYLRALKTIKNLEVVTGHFLIENEYLMKADRSGWVEVIKPKEKGSDVNLATQMMWDASKGFFDVAALISGDLDFISPVKTVRERFGRQVIILDPQRTDDKNSRLLRAASSFKPIRDGALEASQFPVTVYDANRKPIKKPIGW